MENSQWENTRHGVISVCREGPLKAEVDKTITFVLWFLKPWASPGCHTTTPPRANVNSWTVRESRLWLKSLPSVWSRKENVSTSGQSLFVWILLKETATSMSIKSEVSKEKPGTSFATSSTRWSGVKPCNRRTVFSGELLTHEHAKLWMWLYTGLSWRPAESINQILNVEIL